MRRPSSISTQESAHPILYIARCILRLLDFGGFASFVVEIAGFWVPRMRWAVAGWIVNKARITESEVELGFRD